MERNMKKQIEYQKTIYCSYEIEYIEKHKEEYEGDQKPEFDDALKRNALIPSPQDASQ
jgi:hypothetical protein